MCNDDDDCEDDAIGYATQANAFVQVSDRLLAKEFEKDDALAFAGARARNVMFLIDGLDLDECELSALSTAISARLDWMHEKTIEVNA